MSEHKTGLMSDQLSKPTSVFGLRLWVVLGVCVGTAIVLLLFFITLWLASKSKKSTNNEHKIPIVSKEIQEIRIDQPIKPPRAQMQNHQSQDQEMITRKERGDISLLMPPEEESPMKYHGIQIDIGKGHLISYPGSSGEAPRGGGNGGDQVAAMVVPDVSHLGWGHWYTLRELQVATNSFAHENVIGEGGYGIVYHGVLENNTEIAVKNLLNTR